MGIPRYGSMKYNSQKYEIQVAVISDIHGNRWALEAVLEDIEQRKINKILNLGDSLYGPLDPGGTANILIQYEIPTVSGNEDRLIWESRPDQKISFTLDYVRGNLTHAHLTCLESLELTKTAYQFFFLCHGTPQSDQEYLLKVVTKNGVELRDGKSLMDKLDSVDQCVILCGHDHVPALVQLDEDRLVVNPGSVGLPAYNDDLPFPHIMETGSPHTRYSIISGSENSWRIENISLPYDWEAAIKAARKNKRPDWVQWLKTGRASLASGF